jgi:Ca2+-binding EF-hand superfamily protein
MTRDKYGLLPATTRLLQKEFKKYDKDGSGGVDEFELRQVMQDYGVELSKSAHKTLMKKYGIKSDLGGKKNSAAKQIKEEAFLEMMAPYMRLAPSENISEEQLKNLKTTFSRVDADGSGFIDAKELKALLRYNPPSFFFFNIIFFRYFFFF